ncbi:MAG: dienelactone hydrolase family protein [Chitinophagaceae bacterium]
MKKKVLLICIVFFCLLYKLEAFQIAGNPGRLHFTFEKMPDVLPGTKQLLTGGDFSAKMLDGAHAFIEAKINGSVINRLKLWNRNLASQQAYEVSVEPNRQRFIKYIGVEDKKEPLVNYNVGIPDKQPPVFMQKVSMINDQELIAETAKYRVYQVRWPVLNKVYGEGLLLQPKTRPKANIIAIPDADQQPEQLVGLLPGIAHESQFARHLAESGFQVLIPVIISRTLLHPGKEQQQTYREWIYRQAFHMGRHIIGYEVQKVLSAIDWFKLSADKDSRIGVAGYSEGGLIAFYAAAVDKRINAVLVSGYFSTRQRVWDEPIYRNVWGLLSEFGDAEIASLIAPRPMVIEHSIVPEQVEKLQKSSESPRQVEGLDFTGYKGRLQTPSFKDIQAEYNRIDELTTPGFQPREIISGQKNNPVSFGSEAALNNFILFLGANSGLSISNEIPADNRTLFDPEERQVRQVKEIEDHIQSLVRDSDKERNRYFLHKVMPQFAERRWSTKAYHPYYSPDRFVELAKNYRTNFSEEILGKFDDVLLPPNTKTRKIYDKERWSGYEVVLDVFPNLFASGILLIPKDIKPGEKRPVVVCQHGRNDTPQKVIEGNNTAYNDAAAKLADQGFIVYVPQNPYKGEDHYRWLHRKANTVKKTLFSFIIAQHEQSVKWLSTLSFVDAKRIAFYGLSYGGETAMRVPAVLEGYCLSICSGDFGDWTRKVADTHYPGSFMNSLEWEMPYFNMGSTFSYAEMAYLIFPRPFMVERGHHDLVQPDEWVAYEYGKVNYFFDQFNLGDKTEIEFFNGGHSMRSEGTFKFLHKHLNWP